MTEKTIIEQTNEWSFNYTDEHSKPPTYQEYAQEALRLCIQEIRDKLLHTSQHEQTILDNIEKREGIE